MSMRATALPFLAVWMGLGAVPPAARGGELPERAPSEESVGVLAETLRSGTPGRARRGAAEALGRIGSEAGIPPLVGALQDEWEWVRFDAVTALGRIGGGRAAAGLVDALRDPVWNVRREARRALVTIGAPAVEPLVRAAADTEPHLRWQAAWALGRIGSDEAARVLETMRSDPDERVRNEVAAAAERKSRALPPLYPETLAERPCLASPSTAPDGTDLVVMLTREGRWAVVPASPEGAEGRERQRRVDGRDFPTLARTGLHSLAELAQLVTITGRSLAEIDDLGRPGGLSVEGFLAGDEDIRSVLDGDNRLVTALGLTHPQLARPLFHVWNIVEADAKARRWNMAQHRWERCELLVYNGGEVRLEAHDTKGGQESIFDDGLEGAFWIEIRRRPTPDEEALLRREYGHLTPERWSLLLERLGAMQTGEIEPHYVQWYGFYEGHTEWRVDPIAIAFIFGLRTLDEIEAAFPGRLDAALTAHFTG
jgi:hypothetical protein